MCLKGFIHLYVTVSVKIVSFILSFILTIFWKISETFYCLFIGPFHFLIILMSVLSLVCSVHLHNTAIFTNNTENFILVCVGMKYLQLCLYRSSVQFSYSVVSDSLRPHELQHTRPPCPSPTPGVHSNSRSLSRWCHPAISSSVAPFSSCPQSLPPSECFPMSQLFASGSESTGVSALASFLPKNTQGWSPSEWTGWISLQSKGISRVFSNTTVQKHQFFSAQLSSQSISHIHTWPLEKTIFSYYNNCNLTVLRYKTKSS